MDSEPEQAAGAFEGGASVWGSQAKVWFLEGALPGVGEERISSGGDMRIMQSGDGAGGASDAPTKQESGAGEFCLKGGGDDPDGGKRIQSFCAGAVQNPMRIFSKMRFPPKKINDSDLP